MLRQSKVVAVVLGGLKKSDQNQGGPLGLKVLWKVRLGDHERPCLEMVLGLWLTEGPGERRMWSG